MCCAVPVCAHSLPHSSTHAARVYERCVAIILSYIYPSLVCTCLAPSRTLSPDSHALYSLCAVLCLSVLTLSLTPPHTQRECMRGVWRLFSPTYILHSCVLALPHRARSRQIAMHFTRYVLCCACLCSLSPSLLHTRSASV